MLASVHHHEIDHGRILVACASTTVVDEGRVFRVVLELNAAAARRLAGWRLPGRAGVLVTAETRTAEVGFRPVSRTVRPALARRRAREWSRHMAKIVAHELESRGVFPARSEITEVTI